jgi:hypothetical protein
MNDIINVSAFTIINAGKLLTAEIAKSLKNKLIFAASKHGTYNECHIHCFIVGELKEINNILFLFDDCGRSKFVIIEGRAMYAGHPVYFMPQ